MCGAVRRGESVWTELPASKCSTPHLWAKLKPVKNPDSSARRPLSPSMQLGFWVLGAAIAFYALFWLISFLLQYIPEPIGSRASFFRDGAEMTLRLTVWSGLFGLIVGTLAGLGRISKNFIFRGLASFYVWVIRGTPLYVQILFVYNALPPILQSIGINVTLDEFASGVLALTLNVGAYNAEVIRAGIDAVPRGQTEAARSLGLGTLQTMINIVLPQALRIVTPPLVNNLVGLLKDTSLVAAISLVELTMVGSRITSETFRPVPVLTTVALVYLALTTVLTFFTNALERRLNTPGR